MKERPLLFLVLGVLHIIEPFIKILTFKIKTGFPFPVIIENVLAMEGVIPNVEFWLLFPIAGIALLGVKKWSYPVFVSIQAYSAYSILTYEKFTWPYISETPLISSTLLLAFNVSIIGYFLLPHIREPFFDKQIRWWETRIRYCVNIPCEMRLKGSDIAHKAELLNISHSGIFLAYPGQFPVKQDVNVVFEYGGKKLFFKGSIMRNGDFEGRSGLGVKVEYNNIWEKLAMRRVLSDLKKKQKKELLQDGVAAA